MTLLQGAVHVCPVQMQVTEIHNYIFVEVICTAFFTLFLPSLLLLPSALWEFSPSQKIINVHEHLPHCLLARVCMCCQVLSSARILFVHEGSLLGRVCVCLHVGGREQYLRRRKPACCLLAKMCRGRGLLCGLQDQHVRVQGHFP